MEGGPHSCGVCCESFATRVCLEKHSLIHIEEGPILCSICSKSISRQDLKRHSLLHRAERPHVCNICNKAFAKKSMLNKHLLWHSERRPYACGTCNRSFINKFHLDRHSLIHSREKLHVCDVCNKSFSWKCGLKRHAITHRKRWPHVCVVCNKAFAVPKKLKEHLVIHCRKVPEKRVLYTIDKRGSSQVCNFCSIVFTEPICSKLLFLHRDGIDPYACKSCLKDFAGKSSMGVSPTVMGLTLSANPEKSHSAHSNGYHAVESCRGNSVSVDAVNVNNSIRNIKCDQEEREEIAFNGGTRFDELEGTADVKEEHDIDYKKLNSIYVKKESDLDYEVTKDGRKVDTRVNAKEVPSCDEVNPKGEFNVIWVDIKKDPMYFKLNLMKDILM